MGRIGRRKRDLLDGGVSEMLKCRDNQNAEGNIAEGVFETAHDVARTIPSSHAGLREHI